MSYILGAIVFAILVLAVSDLVRIADVNWPIGLRPAVDMDVGQTATVSGAEAQATIAALRSDLATSEAALETLRVARELPGADDSALPLTAVVPLPAVPEVGEHTSPIFGYSLHWDDSWEVLSEKSSTPGGTNRFDQLVLTNGVGSVAFTGITGIGADTKRCLDRVGEGIRNEPRNSEVQFERATDDEAIESAEQPEASGIFSYTLDEEGRRSKRSAFVQCIVLVPGSDYLIILHDVSLVDYEEQIPVRAKLLQGLNLPN